MAGRVFGRVARRPLEGFSASLLEGWVTRVDEGGVAFVDFDNNAAGPLQARSAVRIEASVWADSVARARRLRVLLTFEGIDTSRPIIMGVLDDALISSVPSLPAVATVDGRSVELVAHDQISLCCGLASIVLRADGSIQITGGEVRSHATGRNRIMGSTVAIN